MSSVLRRHPVWKTLPKSPPASLAGLGMHPEATPEIQAKLKELQTTTEALQTDVFGSAIKQITEALKRDKKYCEPNWEFYKERLAGMVDVDAIHEQYKKLAPATVPSPQQLEDAALAELKSFSDITEDFIAQDRQQTPEKYAAVEQLEDAVEIMYDEYQAVKKLMNAQMEAVKAKIAELEAVAGRSQDITIDQILAQRPEWEKEIADDVQNSRWDYDVPKQVYEKADHDLEENKKVWYNPHAGAH